MSLAVYELCIDWDFDGDFLDAGEDVTLLVKYPLTFTRGWEHILDTSPSSSLEFNLHDPDGDYSPENTGSPLYPNVLPGRPVRLRATHAEVVRDLWHGNISKIIPHPHTTEQSTYFYCLDGMDYLAQVDICTELYIAKTEEYIVADILDLAGWPSGAAYRDIDNSVQSTYGTAAFGLWWHHTKALQCIQEFEKITRGRFYVSHEGKAVWESREYRSKQTSQHTFNNTMQQIYYEFGLDLVYNKVLADVKTSFFSGPYAECIVPTWTVGGTLEVDTDVAPTLLTPIGGMKGWKARAVVKTAPTGADLIIDINYDGTTIFTDQTHRLKIAAGAYIGESAALDVVEYSDNKKLTIDVDQIGSGTAGADLTVELICKSPV